MLAEVCRVAADAVVIKDHLLQGVLAGPTLRLMDRVGNQRYGVEIPEHYWSERQWRAAFQKLGLEEREWKTKLSLYPFPLNLAFERQMHFIASLSPSRQNGAH